MFPYFILTLMFLLLVEQTCFFFSPLLWLRLVSFSCFLSAVLFTRTDKYLLLNRTLVHSFRSNWTFFLPLKNQNAPPADLFLLHGVRCWHIHSWCLVRAVVADWTDLRSVLLPSALLWSTGSVCVCCCCYLPFSQNCCSFFSDFLLSETNMSEVFISLPFRCKIG